ncbi:MAG: hypothetical protein ACRDKV_08285 [Solirubrobacterales bacterium]
MSHVRCGKCSLIVEASPRPPHWRCPNCRSLNPVGSALTTALARPSTKPVGLHGG